jgi:thioredoxin reductase (NADPH)
VAVDGDHDIVIVGAGLAGSTAALFAARHGHSTLVVDAGLVPGGQLFNIAKIEDFPGFPQGVAGYDLCPMLQEQAANAGAEFRPGTVDALEEVQGGWSVVVDGDALKARAVVVATGSTPRKLDIPGEARLVGHGVSHCASCDGPIYRERPVAVIGGGDSALLESLELASHVGKVTIFVRSETLRAQRTYVQRAEESPSIIFAYNTVVEEILGDTSVAAVRTRNVVTGQVAEVEVAAVFPYIGSVPQTTLLGRLVQLDDDGRVLTDPRMRTLRPGLLVAGDARRDSAAQAVAVAGDGATAAVAASLYLSDGSWPAEGAPDLAVARAG